MIGERLVRAWDKNFKRMSKPFYVSKLERYDNEGVWILDNDYEICFNSVFMYGLGIADKNGIDIFEGDIIKCIYFNQYKIERNVVVDGDLYFGSDLYRYACIRGSFEILGNIYENKELLERVDKYEETSIKKSD